MFMVTLFAASMPFGCVAFAVAAGLIADDVFIVQSVWFVEMSFEDHTRFAQGAFKPRAAL